MTSLTDSRGNIQSVKKNGEVEKSCDYTDSKWKDKLTSFNRSAITYDAIGNPLPCESDDEDIAALNPIRYRGYYYDSETGLYYLQTRYYDPVTCRFVNADGLLSTGQGILGLERNLLIHRGYVYSDGYWIMP